MAKKKLKKLLKGLGVGAALLGAGKALMNRKDKARQMKEFLATEGGDLSGLNIVDEFAATPKVYQDDIMRGGTGVKNMRKIPGIRVEGEPIRPFGFMFKKGGRVKKGFAKKKKQANKMRKK